MRSPRLTSDGSGGAAGGVTGEEGPVQIVQPPLLHATSPADEQQHDAAPPSPKSGAHSEEAAATPYLHRLWPTDSRDVTPFLLRTAASWALIAALLALYLVVFTAMGHGLSVYQALKPAAEYANLSFAVGGLVLCIAYVSDIDAWPASLDWVRLAVAFEAYTFMGLGVLLCLSTTPEAAHVFMAFSLPLSQTLLKRLLLPQADLLRFMRAMAVGFFLAGTVVLIAFLAWLGSDATSRTLRVAVPDIQNAMQCVQSCSAALFMWAGPVGMLLWCYLLAGLSYYVSQSSDARGRSAGSNLLALGLLFSLLCSWVAAQVGAVQMRVADSLQVLCGAGLASTGIILVIVMGWHDVAQHPALKEALEASYGDWLRAILVSFLALPYAIFLPLSALNQAVRTRAWLAAPKPSTTPQEHARWLTAQVAGQMITLHSWNWSSVGPKAMRVALGFICIIVGLQKMLTLFFVWFIHAVAHTPPNATAAIFVATGVVLLYCIPWMAAVPLYLTGGVVLTAAYMPVLGFWGAAGVAVAICTLTKALSVLALHQTLGVSWMKKADARKGFELRSIRMRAMEMILFRPGLDKAKLYLLVAGPDWLTSVLAGMMGTSVWRVLASQTAPSALLLSLPATFAGAFQLRIHEGGAFGALSSALLFLAAAVQGIGIVFFYYHISHVAKIHEDELKDKPTDREVEELEELFERTQAPLLRAVDERAHWHSDHLPRWMRFVIVVGTVTMGLANAGVRYNSARCFTRFQINDSVACPSEAEQANPRLLRTRKCLGGDATRLVMLEGWVVLGLFALGFACYRLFYYWCHRTMLQLRASGTVVPAEMLPALAAAEEGGVGVQASRKMRPRGKANPLLEIEVPGTAPGMWSDEASGPRVEESGGSETPKSSASGESQSLSTHLHYMHRLSDFSSASGHLH